MLVLIIGLVLIIVLLIQYSPSELLSVTQSRTSLLVYHLNDSLRKLHIERDGYPWAAATYQALFEKVPPNHWSEFGLIATNFEASGVRYV